MVQSGGRGVKQQRQAAQRRTKMPSTVGTKFKDQLKALNKELLATDPHYVRCIKSNSVKQPMNFMRRMVLDQLLYSGVLETVRIRRMGYPYRDTWAKVFVEKTAFIPDTTVVFMTAVAGLAYAIISGA